jgi:dienelactone hydrolase
VAQTLLELEPLEGAHDADVRITCTASGPTHVAVAWTDAAGRYETRVTLAPGGYDADEPGLFRELELVAPRSGTPPLADRLAPVRVELEAGPWRGALVRRTVPAGVRTEVVEEGGLRGVLFEPAAPRHGTGVVCLTGSGGGYALEPAGALAGRGFVTLALAYFGVPGLPRELVEIPLEYLESGVEWLRARPEVERVAVLGSSKGGELALLLGATFASVSAVVAYVPSSQTHAWDTGDRLVACWTHRGKPLPWTPLAFDRNFRTGDGRLSIRPGYEATLEDPAEVERTAIALERTAGPILLISGERDMMWPSSEFANRALFRARARGFPHPIRHLCYADAGHGIGVPNLPRRPSQHDFFELGGTPPANAAASRESWREVLGFLSALDA